MNDRPTNSREGIGDAAWAYNRWPTIGLFTGIGIGAVLGVSFPVGWIIGVLVALAGGGIGCVLGTVPSTPGQLAIVHLVFGFVNRLA